MTEEPIRRVTITIDQDLMDDIEALSEKFISPSTLKPYGKSAVVRACLMIGLKNLNQVTEEQLLYYVRDVPKGSVGRQSVGRKVVRTTLLIPLKVIQKVNAHRNKQKQSIIGTTTYIRLFIRENLYDLTVKALYETIPDKHRELMAENGWTPRKLLDIYQASR